jgi:hypothetical protein
VALTNYLPDAVWDQLLNHLSQSSALQVLLTWATRLGLRLPSEPTIKWIASTWIVLSESQASIALLTEEQKRLLYIHVKREFNKQKIKLPEPAAWVDVLPDHPATFQQQWPDLFQVAYNGLQPGFCRVNINSIAALDVTYGCRGGMKSHGWKPKPCDVPDNVPSAALKQVMDRFESLGNSQTRMFELLMDNKSSARPPRALHALLEDRAPVLAIQAPPPTAGPATSFCDTQETQSVAAADSVTSPQSSETPASYFDNIGTMLNALSERKSDAKRARSEAKSSAQAAGDAEEQSLITSSEPPKAAPKCATAMKEAKAKVKLATADLSVSVLAKTSANTASQLPCPPNEAGPADAALALMPTKYDASGNLILGCSKCRRRASGCRQCRSESFSGLRGSTSA